MNTILARSTFPSENASKASVSERFWKLKCQTIAWREAHVKAKMYKTLQPRNTLEVEMSKKMYAAAAHAGVRRVKD